MNTVPNLRSRLTARLPVFVILLFVLQPVMDVLSYWMAEFGLSNTPTLILRFAVLGMTLLLGFSLSHKKRVYWIAAGICLFLMLGHVFACWQYGYQNIFTDLTNYVRVLQMPLTALCLITFLQENEACFQAVERGAIACLLIILGVQLLAVLTHTEPHTYGDGKGYMGWFNNTNSQSAILSMLTPVAMVVFYQKKGFKSPLFWLVAFGGFAAMFFMGTRLCFLGLFAAGFGLGISILLIRPHDWKKALVFFAMCAVFFAFISQSPMVLHQSTYESVQSERQNSINASLQDNLPPPLNEKGISEEELLKRQAQWVEVLTPVYTRYAPDFVNQFGAKRTIELYNYSIEIRDITATRPRKLQFARLLMESSPVSARLFGVELDRFTVGNTIYDVENDFHGIYYLYGYAGLFSLLAFLGYFLYLIVSALFRNARTYFTLEAAAWGISLLMCLVHCYFTAGVLRRPNASFYLSVALVAVYYLVKIKKYPSKSKNPQEAG